MVNQSQSCDLKDLVQKFIPESIGREIEKATSSIYPLQNVYIRKVKILKAPKFDLGKLMEVSFSFYLFIYMQIQTVQVLVNIVNEFCFSLPQVHGDISEDIGAKIDRPAEETPAEPIEVVGA